MTKLLSHFLIGCYLARHVVTDGCGVTAGGLGNYLRSWYSTPETELYAKL